jgi:cystathionine beta-synthase
MTDTSGSPLNGAQDTILGTIGHTPLIRLQRIGRTFRPQLFVKAEYLNPGGSTHDRIALAMVEAAEREGQLKPGGTIIERTSGSTGIGLALVAAVKGYKLICVVPDKTSDEKIRQLRAYGARVVITPTAVEPEDPRSYYAVARRLAEETPDALLIGQHWNLANPSAHEASTGPEIWQQTNGRIRAFVAAIGTGGTISGVGRFLKQHDPSIQIIGVDPVGSPLYRYFRTRDLGPSASYQVEGGGEELLPDTLDFDVIDNMVAISDVESFTIARRLVREEGLFGGGSSGLALAGALTWLRTEPSLTEDDVVVVLLPDSGTRYLSKLFDDTWMRENGFLPRHTVADVLAARDHPLITIHDESLVGDAITQMKIHGISQLPVLYADGSLRGLVGEGDLLDYLLNGGTPQRAIANVPAREVPTVEPGTATDVLRRIFEQAPVAIVVEHGALVGIVTKIDLIDFLVSQGSA